MYKLFIENQIPNSENIFIWTFPWDRKWSPIFPVDIAALSIPNTNLELLAVNTNFQSQNNSNVGVTFIALHSLLIGGIRYSCILHVNGNKWHSCLVSNTLVNLLSEFRWSMIRDVSLLLLLIFYLFYYSIIIISKVRYTIM